MRACRPGHSCRTHAPGPLGRNACPATLPRAPGQEPQEPKWHLRFASCPGSERQPKSRASPQLSPLHVCKKTGPPLGRTPLGMLARTSQLHSSAQHLAPYNELPAPARGMCAQRRHASTGALVQGTAHGNSWGAVQPPVPQAQSSQPQDKGKFLTHWACTPAQGGFPLASQMRPRSRQRRARNSRPAPPWPRSLGQRVCACAEERMLQSTGLQAGLGSAPQRSCALAGSPQGLSGRVKL